MTTDMRTVGRMTIILTPQADKPDSVSADVVFDERDLSLTPVDFLKLNVSPAIDNLFDLLRRGGYQVR